MATEKKDYEITDLSQDWGGYLGKWVQKLIKDNLISLKNGKLGYIDQEVVAEGNNSHIYWRFFADEDSYKQWYNNKETYAENVKQAYDFVTAKAELQYILRTSMSKRPDDVIVKGSECIAAINYNSYFGEPSEKDEASGKLTVSVNGVDIPDLSQTLESSGTATGNNYDVDLTSYLVSEVNTVKIIVSNTHGQSRTFSFQIKTVSLNLSFDDSYEETKVRGGMWTLRVNCSGVGATVYCKVTNGDGSQTMTKTINNSSGEFVIDQKGTYTAGRHDIELWAVNTEYNITTEKIHTAYIKKGDVSAIAIGKDAPLSATQYSTVQIPYYFYLPSDEVGSRIAVSLRVLYNDGADEVELADQICTLDDEHTSGPTPLKATIPLDLNEYAPKISLVITIGDTSVTHDIAIKSADVTLEPVDECKVYYTMKGRTNADKGIENLESFYNGVRTSYLQRSDNFKLNAYNGFLDGQGLTIGAGKAITLKGWQPFAEDFGANGNKHGRTVEIEFETGLCSDENTVVIDCMDDTTGFRVYANRIEVKCSAAKTPISTYFPETKRIKMSLSIDGVTTHTVNNLGGGDATEKDVNLAYLCINGVCVRMFDYETSNWKQGTPLDIVIGSELAQVKLYSIRGYEKAITPYQALSNFAYDTPDVDDVYDSNGIFEHYGKVNIAKRNDILNSSGNVHNPDEIISYEKVKKALPSTPIIVWNIDSLPYNKNNDNVPINGTVFENPLWNKETDGWATAPFSVGAHMFNADGTSSNGYPLPYKNFAEIFEDSNGGSVNIVVGKEDETDTHTLYSITVGVEKGEKEMVHKVNFASSEGIFNIHAMNMYQQILLACAKSNDGLYTAFQKEQADTGQDVTYRKSLSGFPEIGFRRTSTSGTAAPTFLSFYNFINNKYSSSFLGFPAKDYKTAQIWEVDENVNMFNQMAEDNASDGNKVTQSVLTGKPLYYARVPKKSPTNKDNKLGVAKKVTDNIDASNEELAVIKHFHNWCVSTNVLLAERYKRENGDYATLPSPVVYNGTTYRKDNPAYRRAKFTIEAEQYLKLDSAIFYFNFCQWIIGMDSMDKNMSLAFDSITWNEE